MQGVGEPEQILPLGQKMILTCLLTIVPGKAGSECKQGLALGQLLAFQNPVLNRSIAKFAPAKAT